jgi:dTDP-4-amino-4,6-dideoxygalactose transaminase
MATPIPHFRPSLDKREIAAVAQVIASGRLAEGPQVEALEAELAATVGQRFGIATSSGTAALYLALQGLGIKSGDRVVIPSYVCTALLNAVALTGATAVLADVDPLCGNLTPETVKKALTGRVRAVIVPHLFGQPADAVAIERLGVPVVEDCAQCVGATINGRKAGGQTTLAIFSFYATKVLAAGEGGLIASSDRTMARRIMDLREYDNRETWQPRFNLKLSDLHAAIARVQLTKLPGFIRRRRANAKRYSREFADFPAAISLPLPPDGIEPIYFRYVVRAHEGASRLIKKMQKHGITCARPIFKPLHQYLGKSGFPGSEAIFHQAVSLPCYPALSPAEVDRITAAVRQTLAPLR